MYEESEAVSHSLTRPSPANSRIVLCDRASESRLTVGTRSYKDLIRREFALVALEELRQSVSVRGITPDGLPRW